MSMVEDLTLPPPSLPRKRESSMVMCVDSHLRGNLHDHVKAT